MIETSPTWRMVVSPGKGTFHRAAEAADADVLPAGAVIGEVASTRDSTAVTALHGGQVVEWLVEDGDIVSPGQPLVRLHPRGRCRLMAAITSTHRLRPTPRSSASAPTARCGSSPTPTSSTRSTPATSGSSSARASRRAAGRAPRSRSR